MLQNCICVICSLKQREKKAEKQKGRKGENAEKEKGRKIKEKIKGGL